MSREAYAYVAAGAGGGRTIAANREAFDRVRIVPRMLRDVSARDTSVELFGRRLDSPFLLAPIGVLELAHRERRPRRRARRRGRGRADGDLEPGVDADGGHRRRARRQPAVVPALLVDLGRSGREPRLARRGDRRRGDRGHARHDDARLAHARPRHRLPAVPARQGHRPVHERPGLPPTARRAAGGRVRHRDAASSRSRTCARSARSPRSCATGPTGRSPACAPATRAPRSSGSRRSTRGRRCAGRTCRSCASAPSCRSC